MIRDSRDVGTIGFFGATTGIGAGNEAADGGEAGADEAAGGLGCAVQRGAHHPPDNHAMAKMTNIGRANCSSMRTLSTVNSAARRRSGSIT